MSDLEDDSHQGDSHIGLKSEEGPLEVINFTKMPEFPPHRAETWFRILENRLKMKGIKLDKTMFYSSLEFLPNNLVWSLPESVFEKENYENLKSEILRKSQRSESDLINEFRNSNKLVGKPSEYLGYLENLGKSLNKSTEEIRIQFMISLPENLEKSLIAISKTLKSLDELGIIADEVHQRLENLDSVNKVDFNKESSVGEIKCDPEVYPFREKQKPKVCRSHLYYGWRAKWCSGNNCAMNEKRNSKSRGSSPSRSRDWSKSPSRNRDRSKLPIKNRKNSNGV